MTAVVAALALAGCVLVRGAHRSPRDRLPRVIPSVRPAPEARLPAVLTPLRRLLARGRGRRDRRRREAEVVDAVFALAAELRAGRPPGRALALVAASTALLHQPLADAAGAVDAGARPCDELARVATVPGCAGMHAVAAAWAVTESAGGAVADVLDRLGDVLEAERQARDALDAALAGPRATMLLLAGLPALGLALGQSLGAHPVGLLVHRPLGWALLAVGGVLDGVGIAWTRLLIRRALR